MDSWSNYSNRALTWQEQCLYDHWLQCVEAESPDNLLDRFRKLFIDAVGYSDISVWRALEDIVMSSFAEKEFKFVLNRICHILINRWLMQPRLHLSIPKLVALFEEHPAGLARSWTTQRLRGLIQRFRNTEQYLALRRLAQVISEPSETNGHTNAEPLMTLVRRYPYLYKHGLLTEDSTYEQRQKIRLLQAEAQRQYEIDLSYYITNQLRCSYSAAMVGSSRLVEVQPVLPKGWRSPHNPTLLSDRQLNLALKQFGGKVDGCNTYRDMAQQFLTYSKQTPSYRVFKQELYDYLTASIDPKYGKGQFNPRLCEYLQNTMPQHDFRTLDDTLLMGTCKHLLNFLVVRSPKQLDHFIYSDLTANLGVPFTIGLLLKIVLLCRKVKAHLEKRFSILFNHYESYTMDGVNWLVESLENLNIALSLNFGRINLCY